MVVSVGLDEGFIVGFKVGGFVIWVGVVEGFKEGTAVGFVVC